MRTVVKLVIGITDRLLPLADRAGEYVALVGIRLLLAYEFGVSGLEKLRGSNWFAYVREDFPFPFSAMPVQMTWYLVIGVELLGAAALALGLLTRFFALCLGVLTMVAWMSVHAGLGYNVCQNGYKLALIFLVMLLPLALRGPGRLAIDPWLWARVRPAR